MRLTILAVGLLAWTAAAVQAQPGKSMKFKDVVKGMSASIEQPTLKRGETGTWKFTIELVSGWHTYPSKQPDPGADSFVNKFGFPKPGEVIFVDDLKEPDKPIKKSDPVLQITEMHEYEGSPVWTRKFVVSPDAKPGKHKIQVPVTVQVCDKNSCLPPEKKTVEVEITISDAPAVPVDPKYAPNVPKSNGGTPSPKTEAPLANLPSTARIAEEPEEVSASADQKAALSEVLAGLVKGSAPAKTGIWDFLLTAIFWGAVSLATPCVFPMIPITVSYFLKQSEKAHTSPLLQAVVYCGTIVVVLGIAAMTLLGTFRAISNHPLTNYLLGAFLVVLALSLFGMFELTLPSFLTRFTSSREGKGGLLGTVFMALTFTTVSFTCVAPFLGGFSGMAASGQFSTFQLALGALAFSATFAAPFFLLALFPSLLKKLPKSGGWLNSVKVVMGFLELAAAIKFFRAGELVHSAEPSLFTYDLSLGMWIALATLCGLYLVNVFRVGHDEELESVSVPRLLAGFAFLSLAIYLAPALLRSGPGGDRHRPSGSIYAWVDSFLLPDRSGGEADGLAWSADLKQALEHARRESQRSGADQYVFVDFTGTTCTNCKLNEQNVFTRRAIRDLFKPFKLVQLYTDKVPDELYPASARSRFAGSTTRQRADAAANRWFQNEAFGTEQLPLYVILKPTRAGSVEIVGTYDEAKINNVTAFEDFLRKPFSASNARVSLK